MKVRAKNDDIRKVIRHPVGGAFREDGSAEWPDDAYTYRRIADGDVTVVEDKKKSEPKAAAPYTERHNPPKHEENAKR